MTGRRVDQLSDRAESLVSAVAVIGPAPDSMSRGSLADLPCRVQDPDLWFAAMPALLEQAKEFCAGCPAQVVCLAGAIRRREPWGVWGGEIFDQGQIVARKRPRGRPRKNDIAA